MDKLEKQIDKDRKKKNRNKGNISLYSKISDRGALAARKGKKKWKEIELRKIKFS